MFSITLRNKQGSWTLLLASICYRTLTFSDKRQRFKIGLSQRAKQKAYRVRRVLRRHILQKICSERWGKHGGVCCYFDLPKFLPGEEKGRHYNQAAQT